ncbi:MAG TPA: hypothetical protein VL970_08540, partial [Candidatus Acidoferrales bacterium]|nr:hypothetical protein [Candidatus Acidoferrales bacterium]
NPDPAVQITDDAPYNEYYLLRRLLHQTASASVAAETDRIATWEPPDGRQNRLGSAAQDARRIEATKAESTSAEVRGLSWP